MDLGRDLIQIICDELGVEVNEPWTGNDDTQYKFTSSGFFYYYTGGEWIICDSVDMARLMLGTLFPKWKPKIGDIYYVIDGDDYTEQVWINSITDNILYELGVCKRKV